MAWVLAAAVVVFFGWAAQASDSGLQGASQCTAAKTALETAQKKLTGLQNQLDRAKKDVADCEAAAKKVNMAPNCGAQGEKVKGLTKQVDAQRRVVDGCKEDYTAACKM
jgi:hypothetical protein